MSVVSLNLEKGQRIDLTKGTGITAITAALGWDEGGRDNFDLDASVMLLTPTEKKVIFYNNLTEAGFTHSGDNLTGAGVGDKELIAADLSTTDPTLVSAYYVINIHKAAERSQNFGMVNNAYVRIFDTNTGTELCRYDLSEDYSTATGIVVGRLYSKEVDGKKEWKFSALGDGVTGDLQTIINNLP